MIIQACLNGGHPAHYHPRLPLTPAAIARDAVACLVAGAAELHVHARDADGRERLDAVDATVAAVRQACPGTLLGVSTGAWIEDDEARTRQCIAAWRALPDYASVNLAESDAPALLELLRERDVGVEAGLGCVADAQRLVAIGRPERLLRILLEIDDQDPDAAREQVAAMAGILEDRGFHRPILLHGTRRTVWPMLDLARQRRWSARIGLEDGKQLPDGSLAEDNAALVRAAVAIYRAG